MKNQKLSTKLILAFLAGACVTILIGVAGIYGVLRLKSHISEVGQVRVPSLEGLSYMDSAINDVDSMENSLMIPSYPAEKRLEVEKEVKEAWESYKKGLSVYESLPQTAEEATLWKDFETKLGVWKKHHETFMALNHEYLKAQQSNADAATLKALNEKMTHQMFTYNDDAIDAAKEVLGKVVKLNQTIANSYTEQAMVESKRFLVILVALCVGGAVGATIFGVMIGGAISAPLRKIAGQLTDGATETTSAATQVSSASQSLAQGASEQAASLEETSSSLEEMASMTKRNAEHASHAKELAQDAHHSAEKAGDDIASMSQAMEAVGRSSEQLRTAMDKIASSSSQISQVMKTIDEIAFQTNILSLNAAVEAARAGEAGAGFAVVADEVRALAHRSAEAAKQTAQMIKDSADSSHQGKVVTEKVAADLVNMAQASERVKSGLAAIVGKAREVDSVIGEIATASREQEQGISQLNTAVSQMDKVTQSSAASAEETASASEELNAQAQELKAVIAQLLQLVNGGEAAALSETPVGIPKRVSPSPTPVPSAPVASTASITEVPSRRNAPPKTNKGTIPLDDDSFHDM